LQWRPESALPGARRYRHQKNFSASTARIDAAVESAPLIKLKAESFAQRLLNSSRRAANHAMIAASIIILLDVDQHHPNMIETPPTARPDDEHEHGQHHGHRQTISDAVAHPLPAVPAPGRRLGVP
jgi:hypothetical protein